MYDSGPNWAAAARTTAHNTQHVPTIRAQRPRVIEEGRTKRASGNTRCRQLPLTTTSQGRWAERLGGRELAVWIAPLRQRENGVPLGRADLLHGESLAFLEQRH
jgi:hypothetical protein